MSQLPDKPSELIRLAVADLERAEASPDYIVDMVYWHEPMFGNNKCAVCFAGALLAGTLGRALSDRECAPDHVHTSQDDYKLFGLDSLRIRLLSRAVDNFARAATIPAQHAALLLEDRRLIDAVSELPGYDDPIQFKSGMRKIASEFERNGY